MGSGFVPGGLAKAMGALLGAFFRQVHEGFEPLLACLPGLVFKSSLGMWPFGGLVPVLGRGGSLLLPMADLFLLGWLGCH